MYSSQYSLFTVTVKDQPCPLTQKPSHHVPGRGRHSSPSITETRKVPSSSPRHREVYSLTLVGWRPFWLGGVLFDARSLAPRLIRGKF